VGLGPGLKTHRAAARAGVASSAPSHPGHFRPAAIPREFFRQGLAGPALAALIGAMLEGLGNGSRMCRRSSFRSSAVSGDDGQGRSSLIGDPDLGQSGPAWHLL